MKNSIISFYLTASERAKIKELAAQYGKTETRLIIDAVLYTEMEPRNVLKQLKIDSKIRDQITEKAQSLHMSRSDLIRTVIKYLFTQE